VNEKLKKEFVRLWEKYFGAAELPIVFWYSDKEESAERVKPAAGHRCIVCDLAAVRKGKSLCFDVEAIGCCGGKKYLGFSEEVMPNFEYFLSCGIPGKLEGERYKKTPELVKKTMKHWPGFKISSRFITFKRWDRLEAADNPEVVIFFARPDVISGLFTLANFDRVEPNGVFAPFSAGCGSIVMYPHLETTLDSPRAVLGMFDVSARPCVGPESLTFAVPFNKLLQMVENMEESFLITESWKKVRKRIKDV